MAKNTSTPVTPSSDGSAFLAKVFMAQIRQRLAKNLVIANAFTLYTDYDGGSTVTIDVNGRTTAKQYSGTINWDEIGLNEVTFKVDHNPYAAVKVSENAEALSVNKDLVVKKAEEIALSISESWDKYLGQKLIDNAKLLTGTTAAGTPITDPGDLYKLAIKMKTALDQVGVPKIGRQLLIDPLASGMLYMDPRFTNSEAVAGEVIREGSIGRFAGFDVYESNNLPLAEDDKSVYMLATHPKMNDRVEALNKLDIIKLQDSFDTGIRALFLGGAQAGCGIEGTVVGAVVDLSESA